MPTEPLDVRPIAEKVDALRRDFDAFVVHDHENVSVRAHRFAEIDRRLRAIEEALKRIESRLGNPTN